MVQDKLKIISYSLFGYSGRNGNYWAYIPAMLRLHSILLPDYKIALYHDDTLFHMQYGEVLKCLDETDFLDLNYMGSKDNLCQSMLWRCKAIWDYPDAIAVFFRDLDSCPTYRERCANEEFINSKYYVHGINDNKAHSVPLMGGMWGCEPKHFIKLTNYNSWNFFTSLWKDLDLSIHGTDQLFLKDFILPKIKQDLLVCKDIKLVDFPEIDREIKTKDEDFIPYIGAAGYARDDVIRYCNSKDTSFINKLKSIEAKYNIEAISHNFIKKDYSESKLFREDK